MFLDNYHRRKWRHSLTRAHTPVTPAVPAPAPALRPQQPIALHTRKRARVGTPNASAVDDTEAPDTSNDHGIAAALAEEEKESTESTTGTLVLRAAGECADGAVLLVCRSGGQRD